ncbi:MAG: M61 family peptidase [Bacteroidota bacterium]
MRYTISCEAAQAHYLAIELLIPSIVADEIELQLPAWRPGRYELANFAKNIQRFEVCDEYNRSVSFQKTTKDRWKVQTKGIKQVRVRYTYYAQQRDAGGSWLDETLVYINFINCLVYMEGRISKTCEVQLQMPANYQIACGLSETGKHLLQAKDYYELVDSPMLASEFLQHETYQVDESTFHLWLWGNCQPSWENVKADFKRFTQKQMQVMAGSQPDSFPSPHYHFIFQFLPYKHYHGVEHHNSTMIVLGPDTAFDQLYPELLGISSHELFHAWNVIRIRPAELLPYDFTKENYFPTGFVAEGVTTYYGDLFLKRSGVFTLEAYLAELNTTLKRHFENNGQAFQSLVESSFDLWLDGYTAGIPNRKVSIYHKGAIVALILDLEIRQRTSHVRSLDDVMRFMWEHFGKRQVGYTIADYRAAVEEVTGRSQQSYFDECITSNAPLETRLNQALDFVGLTLVSNNAPAVELRFQDNIMEGQRENLERWLS